MNGDLATTNLLLGIMAAVSVLESLLVIALIVACWRMYQSTTRAVQAAEVRHVAPLLSHVHIVLDDVKDVTTTLKGVTATLKEETDRLHRLIGIARGLHRVVQGFLHAA
jgi:hypothetical protein